MAQSRLEKVGTIYTRMTSLIKSGAMKEENQPFWIKLYEAFPPKYEPRYDRPVSTAPIRQIFYAEDKIRAKFHKDHKHLSLVDLANNNSVSRTEQFIKIYRKIEKEGDSEDKVYEKAVEELMTQYQTEKEARAAEASQSSHGRRRGIKKVLKEQSESTQAVSQQDTEDLKKYKPIRFSLEKLLKEEEESIKTQDENIKKSE